MSCVSFSCLNVIETLMRRKYAQEVNYSDRFLAQVSGTRPTGNTFVNVIGAIRKLGSPPEPLWPYPQNASWLTYYAEPSLMAKKAASQVPKDWLIRYEWVMENWRTETYDNETLMEALKYGPLQIAIRAYGPANAEGIHTRITGQTNHGVMLMGYEEGKYWKIFDSYLPAVKLLAWDYYIDAALKISIQPNIMPATVSENYLYQLVEGIGGFALAIGNVLYIDEPGKLLASWLVRNNGVTSGKTGTLTQAQWDSLPHKNLKGESIP